MFFIDQNRTSRVMTRQLSDLTVEEQDAIILSGASAMSQFFRLTREAGLEASAAKHLFVTLVELSDDWPDSTTLRHWESVVCNIRGERLALYSRLQQACARRYGTLYDGAYVDPRLQ